MELIRYDVIRIWSMWVFAVLLVTQVEGKCKSIPFQDIQDAAYFSKAIYVGNFIKGDGVPRVPSYTVQKLIRKDLSARSMDVFGEPLRVMVAKKASPPTTLICFMGTKSGEQLYEQFKAGTFKKRERVRIGGREVKVMKYFWTAFQELIEVIKSIEISDKMKYIVTGHSLGGALANLFSIYMTDKHDGDMWKNPASTLITFGAPRVGDSEYAALHDFLIQPFRKPRIILNKDVVPHIPPKGNLIQDYVHTSREIWIEMKKEGKAGRNQNLDETSYMFRGPGADIVWHVCPDGDGNKCSNGMWSFKYKVVADHNMDKYVNAVTALGDNKKDLDKFNSDQC